METRRHVCNLCEAGCGMLVDVEDGRPVAVRADEGDVHSRGHSCPKGLALVALDADPDRLRHPVRRGPGGRFERVGWDEALDEIAARIRAIQAKHGRDAVAVYMGTPVVHKGEALLMRQGLMAALGTRNSTSAGSQDTSPRFVTSFLLYGASFAVPVPDIDRTRYLLCVGANPVVSNGSLLTAPGIRERLLGVKARGGKVVVVDPRRSETAELADEHLPVLPGGDAALLLSMTAALVEERRVDERELLRVSRGWPELRRRLAPFTPERVEPFVGIPAATIRRIARELAAAPSAAVYPRIGVCNVRYGTLANFAADVLNLATGRLGAIGGAMFATPAIDLGRLARLTGSDGHARWHSRLRKLPETAGDLPAAVLAEEMETEGEGQVKAFLTLAGNPVLSTPNGRRLGRALAGLDLMVSVDWYVNETTRHAHFILPPAGPFADGHVDLFFAAFGARNTLRWTRPAVPRGADERLDWEIFLELACRLGGGPSGIVPVDALVRAGRRLGIAHTPDLTIDLAIRAGAHGDHFLPGSSGLRGETVRAAPGGVDLGPLRPGLRDRIVHPDGLVDLTAAPLLRELAELDREVSRGRAPDELLLVGRRDPRSNNSWMHNLPKLAAGKDRCVLHVHPDDAARLGLTDGGLATLGSSVHSAEVPVAVTDAVRPGVVSLPHGFGHGELGEHQRVASKVGGVSMNDFTDDAVVEAVVGQAVLTAVPVTLRPAPPPSAVVV